MPAVPAFGGVTLDAIARVCDEARPDIRDVDELHDTLVAFGLLSRAEIDGFESSAGCGDFLAELEQRGRVTAFGSIDGVPLYAAAERLHEVTAVFPSAAGTATAKPTCVQTPLPATALRELVRSRLELLGPVTVAALGAPFGLPPARLEEALLALESEGSVMRGSFTSPDAEEWCDRRLLTRMYRYSRELRHAAVRPVPAAQFLRFLLRWHRISGDDGRRAGEAGLLAALQQLEGCQASTSVWEGELLPARVEDYSPAMLDRLCAAGCVAWHRPPGAPGNDRKSGPVRGTPVLLGERSALPHWQAPAAQDAAEVTCSAQALRVLTVLRAQGASFASDILHGSALLRTELEAALGELVSNGLVHCDSFAGLRALTRRPRKGRRLLRNGSGERAALEEAGRWALVRPMPALVDAGPGLASPPVEHIARALLRRYGVVFRKLLEREQGLPPWRELFYVYRRMEARGEVQGSRFVSGFSGEQFALPEAAAGLRRTRVPDVMERVALSASDPLNLVGVLTPDPKVAKLPGSRILFENGVPVASRTVGGSRLIGADGGATLDWERQSVLVRRPSRGVGSGATVTGSRRDRAPRVELALGAERATGGTAAPPTAKH